MCLPVARVSRVHQVGTLGTTTDTQHDTAEAAQGAADKLVLEQKEDGWSDGIL